MDIPQLVYPFMCLCRIVGYKVSLQKSVVFIYTSNEQMEFEILFKRYCLQQHQKYKDDFVKRRARLTLKMTKHCITERN